KRWVAAEQPMWVRFSHPVASEDMLNRPIDDLIQVSPKVAITATFTADNELRIAPVERLPSEQALTFSLRTGKLQDVDPRLPPFTFEVHTIRQDFDLKLDSLAVQESSDGMMRL